MFSIENMGKFALEAWGPLGLAVVARWQEFNHQYFAGTLKPIPIVISNTLPFGKRIGFCAYSGVINTHGRAICLNMPKGHNRLVANNSVLLHEMLHQFLQERGEDAAHAGAGWRSEIMRLHPLLTDGRTIWAGRRISKRVRGCDGSSHVLKIEAPGPNGELSINQDVIARWPSSMGIDLGTLGAPVPASHVALPQRRTAA